VGSITQAQLEDIAKQKMPDLNTTNMDSAKRMVEGTARSMGIEIK
jgi:large subunit ribosomal protein L11